MRNLRMTESAILNRAAMRLRCEAKALQGSDHGFHFYGMNESARMLERWAKESAQVSRLLKGGKEA